MLFNFKLRNMKTIHRILDAIIYLLWLSLFIYGTIIAENIFWKVLGSLAAFLIAAYLVMSIFYGIVRAKQPMLMIIPYAILLGTMGYSMVENGVSTTNLLFVLISTLNIIECLINRKIEKEKQRLQHG